MSESPVERFERQVIAHHNAGAKALDPQGHLPFGQPLARRTDPETSHEAAASVSNTAAVREWLLLALRTFGPLSDTDLHALHVLNTPEPAPPCSESGLRTRRAELVAVGSVLDSGQRAQTKAGRVCIRWVVAGTVAGAE